MIFQESETVELKEKVTEDIKKEIIAFANCNGGTIYIGVRDDGTVVGLDNVDNVSLQVSNIVRDNIKPDVTMFLHYKAMKIDDKEILSLKVQRGTARPYYLAKKGMRIDGVYVRQGFSSAPATDNAIRNMIKEADGDSYEEMRSLEQELTFEATKKEFISRQIDFGPQQMRTLKLIDSDGLYTNTGLLLSDQCVHTIKLALFQGTDQMIFKDRKEFSGSLLEQLNEVFAYIDFRNGIRGVIEGKYRVDTRDYPETAIREALYNLLIHRDYSYKNASGMIKMFEDRIEFVSVGGLLPGVDEEDILNGISVSRNPNLAAVFFRLKIVEAYGTGLAKIMNEYKDANVKPEIVVTNNSFKVILPNVNFLSETEAKYCYEPQPRYSANTRYRLAKEEERVMQYAKEHGSITKNEVSLLLNTSSSTAIRVLRKLIKKGLIEANGNARSTYYTLK